MSSFIVCVFPSCIKYHGHIVATDMAEKTIHKDAVRAYPCMSLTKTSAR